MGVSVWRGSRAKMFDHLSIICLSGPEISSGPGISNNMCASVSDGSTPRLSAGSTTSSKHRRRAVSCFL